MTVAEVISKLQDFPQDMEVKILDPSEDYRLDIRKIESDNTYVELFPG